MTMRRPRPVCLVVLAVLSGLAPPASAQSNLPIAVDQRVRLWTDAADAVTGRVTAVTPATAQVAVDGRDPVTIATTAVRRVEISRGRTSRGVGFRKGAIRGALIMGALGAISLGLQHEQVGEEGSSVAKAAALGVWSGGLFGGLIGGAIGAARAGDRWEQVWP
jgi:hypothetical protein